MNTLAQYQKLTTDVLLKGVFETIIKESPIMARLPFKEHSGNSLTFNIEDVMATVGWYAVGDTWVESANTWAQGSTALVTMGGDVDTDKFAIKTKGNINDVRAVNVEGKSKAMAHEWDRAFLYGGTTTTPNANEIKGILKWIANYENTNLNTTDLDGLVNEQVIANHATSAVLSLPKLDEMIDAVRPGKPDCLIMDRRIRRYLNSLINTTGTSYTAVRLERDDFGRFIGLYNEIPILINDFQKDNMRNNDGSSVLAIASYVYADTRAADKDNSFILALQFSETNGVCGVQNGAMEHEDLGELETKRAYRNRFAWDCGLVMLGKKCAAVLTGVVADAL